MRESFLMLLFIFAKLQIMRILTERNRIRAGWGLKLIFTILRFAKPALCLINLPQDWYARSLRSLKPQGRLSRCWRCILRHLFIDVVPVQNLFLASQIPYCHLSHHHQVQSLAQIIVSIAYFWSGRCSRRQWLPRPRTGSWKCYPCLSCPCRNRACQHNRCLSRSSLTLETRLLIYHLELSPRGWSSLHCNRRMTADGIGASSQSNLLYARDRDAFPWE